MTQNHRLKGNPTEFVGRKKMCRNQDGESVFGECQVYREARREDSKNVETMMMMTTTIIVMEF